MVALGEHGVTYDPLWDDNVTTNRYYLKIIVNGQSDYAHNPLIWNKRHGGDNCLIIVITKPILANLVEQRCPKSIKIDQKLWFVFKQG